MLDLVAIALHAESPEEESHRFAVATSEIYKLLSGNEFQLFFH